MSAGGDAVTVFTKSEVEGYASFSAQEYALRATALYALARAERAERVVEAARAWRDRKRGTTPIAQFDHPGQREDADLIAAVDTYDEAHDG